MIKIESFVFSDFSENTYVLSDQTNQCVIIDPGCYTSTEKQQLKDHIEKNSLSVVKLLNTHCHIDHVFGNAMVKDQYKVDLYIHKEGEMTLRAVKTYAAPYGFPHFEDSEPDHFLEEGDTVTFGESKLEVTFVPGHAPGHIVFVNREQNFCIGGDVLFRESIGRTDLPGGDHQTLIDNIHREMFTFPDDMTIYPGHGPTTTIGHEKVYNPFCAIAS